VHFMPLEDVVAQCPDITSLMACNDANNNLILRITITF